MVTAIILINVDRKHVQDAAQNLHKIEGVSEVYSVAGEYDLVAILRTQTNEQIAEIVTGKLLKQEGIQKTETLIAFESFSKYDLEHLFSIGQE